jgi:hypothetical protein
VITQAALPPAERRGGTLARGRTRATATVLVVLALHAGLLLLVGDALGPRPVEPGLALIGEEPPPLRLAVRAVTAVADPPRAAAPPAPPAQPAGARAPARDTRAPAGVGASTAGAAPRETHAATAVRLETAIARQDPEPAGSKPVEAAPARIAPPFRAVYRWQQDGLEGQATLVLAFDAAQYTLALRRERAGQPPLHGVSRGRSGVHGLAPERHVEGQAGRDQRALNFVREGAGRILASDHAGERPLPAGAQDPVSWLVQLAGLVDADPALRQPGAVVALWMAGPRGQLDVWQLAVLGPALGVEGRPLLKLVRAAERPWDVALEIWLDPAERHLPHTVAWQRQDGQRQAPLQRLVRTSLAWTGPGS